MSESNEVYSQPVETINEVQMTLSKVKEVIETHYEINRERATEAVVFLVSDLDRSWDKEEVKWSPWQ